MIDKHVVSSKILCTGMVVLDNISPSCNGGGRILVQRRSGLTPSESSGSQLNDNETNAGKRTEGHHYHDCGSEDHEGVAITTTAKGDTSATTTGQNYDELRDQPDASCSSRQKNSHETSCDEWFTAIEGKQNTRSEKLKNGASCSNRASSSSLSRSSRRGLVRRFSHTIRNSLSFTEKEEEETKDAWYVRTTATSNEVPSHVMQMVFFDFMGPPEEEELKPGSPEEEEEEEEEEELEPGSPEEEFQPTQEQ